MQYLWKGNSASIVLFNNSSLVLFAETAWWYFSQKQNSLSVLKNWRSAKYAAKFFLQNK